MATTRGLRALQKARARKKSAADGGIALGATGIVEEILKHALAAHQAGQIGQAKQLYRQILKTSPERFEALMFLAIAEYQSGSFDEAERFFRQAIAVNPRSAATHSNFSLLFCARRDFLGAVAECDLALALEPDFADAHCNRANALHALGCDADALVAIDRAIALRPALAQAHSIRGGVLRRLKRNSESTASYSRAIALNPGSIEDISNRAALLVEAKNYDAALEDYSRLSALVPDSTDARLARAKILHRLTRIDEAIAEYNEILHRRPDDYEVLTLLGQCQDILGDVEATLTYYEKALAIKPDFAPVIHNRIYALDFSDRADESTKQFARSYWWQQIGAKIANQHGAQLRRFENVRDPERRLVIGYVSSDFRKHSVALVFRPILRLHERNRFEVVCYSCSALEDEWTDEFRQLADRWRDAAHWSHDRLTEEIVADRIDILVDLSGHSAGNRLEVFARRAAPIQVTAWGHATGSGIPEFDYMFADQVVIPAAVRHLFAETIYDLPCVISMEKIEAATLRDPPVMSRRFITYGVFNRIAKISDRALDAWATLLNEDPSARLVVKHSTLDDESVRNRLVQRFLACGISSNRIDLLGETTRDGHLEAIQQVDICLDTFPHNGGVSSWESLFLGVPLVALQGQTVVSRVSASILQSIGMSELIATNVQGYVEIARALASAPVRLKSLRTELPLRIARSQSGNNAEYTKAVETGYRTMWRNYCRQAG